MPKPAGAKINVTPMIDVVMVLIVFYLIVGKLATDQRADLPLPQSATGEVEDVAGAIVVDVRRGLEPGAPARISLAGVELSAEALEAALRSEFEGGAQRPLRIRADRTLAYGAVRPTIEAARRAGASVVRLATERAGR